MAYAPINQSTYLFCDLKYQFNAIEEAFMYLRKFPSYFCYRAVNFENLEISNDMNVERPGNVGYFNQSCEQHVRNKCFSECCTKMSAVSGIFRFQRKCLLIRFSEEHLSHVLNLGNVAVHCHAGLGRTGVVIASYLVWRYHLSADEAINYVRKKRWGDKHCYNFKKIHSQLKLIDEFQTLLGVLYPKYNEGEPTYEYSENPIAYGLLCIVSFHLTTVECFNMIF